MIFIASLLAIFAVSSIIYSSLFRSSSEKGIKVSHNKKDEFLIFDEFKGLYKTNILLSNLSTSETPFGSLKNYDYNNIKNVLLFDYVTKKSQWIFSNNQNYIYRDHTYIHENSDDDCCMRSEEPKSKTIGIIFKFADKDTNNDEKITKEDKIKLIHKNLESGKETILLMDADNILAIKRISINEMAIFYTKNLKSYYKYYNFTDYKVSNETAL